MDMYIYIAEQNITDDEYLKISANNHNSTSSAQRLQHRRSTLGIGFGLAGLSLADLTICIFLKSSGCQLEAL